MYSWAELSMKGAIGKSLMEGIDEMTLEPNGNATRAQVAATLMRFIEKVK